MPTHEPPTRAEIEREASSWPEEYLECRLDGHIWRPARAVWHSRYRYYHQVQACQRCTSERHTEITERGSITARWIDYADGYLTRNVGRITGEGRDVLRLATLQRAYTVTNTRKMTELPHSGRTRRTLGLVAGAA